MCFSGGRYRVENELIKAPIEGLLFASGDEGITVKQLANILNIKRETVEIVLDELKQDYQQTDRGIMIMQSHEVYHLTTKPEHSEYFKRLLETPQSRSEEHTSELQSRGHLVCRLLLEKK